MYQPKILLQLDTDTQASTFDAVVALDSGVQHLLQYPATQVENVTTLVHGAMFTRGPAQLCNTACFIGGSDVAQGEELLAKIQATFFGPIRVSVMLDSNGANTTASAAVLCAARHLSLSGAEALVLGGTGPVGGRVARLLLSQGCRVHLASRSREKALLACDNIRKRQQNVSSDQLHAIGTENLQQLQGLLKSTSLLVACGAAGATLLTAPQLSEAQNLRVAIDLNAVPPAGLEGIDPMDKARQRGERIDYGAIGVGGLKMKIHRAAIQSLFSSNDQVLDLSEIFAVGQQLETGKNSE